MLLLPIVTVMLLLNVDVVTVDQFLVSKVSNLTFFLQSQILYELCTLAVMTNLSSIVEHDMIHIFMCCSFYQINMITTSTGIVMCKRLWPHFRSLHF